MRAVTVIIPCYNKGKYVKNCIESVMRQTYKPLEVIVVDDCSTDNSCAIISELQQKYDNLLLSKNERNMGVSATRNRGADLAASEYITFIDADDFYYDADKIKREIAQIEKHPNAIAFSDILVVSGNAEEQLRRYKYPKYLSGKSLRIRNFANFRQIQCRDYIVSKSNFKKTGGYDVDCSLFEDLDLLMKLSNSCDFYNTGDIGTAYRDVQNGLSKKDDKTLQEAANNIINKYLSQYSWFSRKYYTAARATANCLRRAIKRVRVGRL